MASNVNRTVVSGNLTRDPEEKMTQNGTCVLEIGIAVNESRKNAQGDWEDKANFIDCTMYGKRASGIAPYLRKGMHVTIDGHLRQERWEKDGQKRSKLKLIVDELDFSGNRGGEQAPETESEPAEQQGAYDEDIPF